MPKKFSSQTTFSFCVQLEWKTLCCINAINILIRVECDDQNAWRCVVLVRFFYGKKKDIEKLDVDNNSHYIII